MRVSDLGEFGLIDALCRRVPTSASDLVLPVGDDTAVWRPRGLSLATTDTMVDGIHFRASEITPAELGWKALAVNLSDIASMGGVPRWALVTLGLRRDAPTEWLEGLYDGLGEACQAFGVVVAGGDIVSTDGPLFITVALLGDADASGALMRRAAAEPGDLIAVTGALGGSAAWLRPEAAAAADTVSRELRQAHFRPRPRVAAGQALLAAGVRCGMDISDGLVQDLGHICRASGVSARVDLARVAVSPPARAVLGRDAALDCALYGGEDYELLVCAPADVLDHAAARLAEIGTPLTVIGAIVPAGEAPVVLVGAAGARLPAGRAGWDHLRGDAGDG